MTPLELNGPAALPRQPAGCSVGQACSERRQAPWARRHPGTHVPGQARPATRRLSRATGQIRFASWHVARHHTRDSATATDAARLSAEHGHATQWGPNATGGPRRPNSATRARRSREQIPAHRWRRPCDHFVFNAPGLDRVAVGASARATAAARAVHGRFARRRHQLPDPLHQHGQHQRAMLSDDASSALPLELPRTPPLRQRGPMDPVVPVELIHAAAPGKFSQRRQRAIAWHSAQPP